MVAGKAGPDLLDFFRQLASGSAHFSHMQMRRRDRLFGNKAEARRNEAPGDSVGNDLTSRRNRDSPVLEMRRAPQRQRETLADPLRRRLGMKNVSRHSRLLHRRLPGGAKQCETALKIMLPWKLSSLARSARTGVAHDPAIAILNRTLTGTALYLIKIDIGATRVNHRITVIRASRCDVKRPRSSLSFNVGGNQSSGRTFPRRSSRRAR